MVFPLLSILSLSPAQLQTRQVSRQLASVVEQKAESKHPRFDKIISKVDKQIPAQGITVDKFLEKTGAMNDKLKKERESFKKNIDNKDEVALQRKGIEALISELVVLEEELKALQDKKILKDEHVIEGQKSLEEFKIVAEELLTELESNETLVAKTEEPKKEEAVVVKEEPKKEEPKEEETKKEETKKEEVCKDDKSKVLPSSANELYAQQNMILQQMLGVSQMMLMMLQQQQMYQMQQQFQLQGPVNQQAYQYLAPTQGGSWVFQPTGTGRPGMYPDQFAHQPQFQPPMQYQQPAPQDYNGWGFAPQQYFTPQTMQPGQFGGPQLGFNMTPTPGPQLQPYLPKG